MEASDVFELVREWLPIMYVTIGPLVAVAFSTIFKTQSRTGRRLGHSAMRRVMLSTQFGVRVRGSAIKSTLESIPHSYVSSSGRLYTGVTGIGCLWLPPDQHPRRAVIDLLESSLCEGVVLLIILANCVTLAMDSPSGIDPATEATLELLNRYFLYVYTCEAFLKMVALGTHCGAGSYLRDGWALFELFIVLVSWAPLLFDLSGGKLSSVVRAFRALRVLLALTHIPGMLCLLTAATSCLPALGSVLGLCALLVTMAGIVGVQFLKGALHYRCASPDILSIPSAAVEQAAAFDTGELCGATRTCAHGDVCFRFSANPTDGVGASFDSFGDAIVPLLSTFLLDGWSDAMRSVMHAYSVHVWAAFVFLAVVGGMLMLQLFLAVVSETFVRLENARKVAEKVEQIREALGIEPGPLPSIVDQAAAQLGVTAEGLVPRADACHAMLFKSTTKPSEAAGGDASEAAPDGDTLRPSPLNEPSPVSVGDEPDKATNNGLMPRLTKQVTSAWFGNVAVGLVVFNIVVMCLPYRDEPPSWTRVHEGLSTLLTWAFILEMCLKLAGIGCAAYWSDAWNTLDGSLVLLSIGELLLLALFSQPTSAAGGTSLTQMLRMLRILRLLRAIRAMRAWTGMYKIILAFLTSLPQIANLLLLTVAIMYLFAVVGMALYGASGLSTNSREHFDTFGVAMLSVLNMFNGNLIDSIHASIEVVGRPLTGAYYGAAILIGFLGIMNLFVAVLLEAFGDDDGDGDGDGEGDGEGGGEGGGRDAGAGAPVAGLPPSMAELAPPVPRGEMTPAAADRIASLEQRLHELEEMNQKLSTRERTPQCCGDDVRDTPTRRCTLGFAKSEVVEYAIIILIGLSSLCLVLDHPTLDPSSPLAQYLHLANYAFTIIFTIEALIKVYAHGPRDYFASAWNRMDVLIVATSLLALLSDLVPQLAGLTNLRILRVLRPLRLLVRNRGMKVVVDALVATMPAVLNISGIVLALQVHHLTRSPQISPDLLRPPPLHFNRSPLSHRTHAAGRLCYYWYAILHGKLWGVHAPRVHHTRRV